MKRPNITQEEWNTAHEFPGCVIAGKVEDSPRGKSAMIVCKVQGNRLATYKPNLQFIAAAPDMAKALEDCYAGLSALWAIHAKGAQNDTLDAAKAALIKAGYEFP